MTASKIASSYRHRMCMGGTKVCNRLSHRLCSGSFQLQHQVTNISCTQVRSHYSRIGRVNPDLTRAARSTWSYLRNRVRSTWLSSSCRMGKNRASWFKKMQWRRSKRYHQPSTQTKNKDWPEAVNSHRLMMSNKVSSKNRSWSCLKGSNRRSCIWIQRRGSYHDRVAQRLPLLMIRVSNLKVKAFSHRKYRNMSL